MSTRALVPRQAKEGGIGTANKPWGSIYADKINTLCRDTAYSVGDVVFHSVMSRKGMYLQCIEAGITDLVEPTLFPKKESEIMNDGTVIWKCCLLSGFEIIGGESIKVTIDENRKKLTINLDNSSVDNNLKRNTTYAVGDIAYHKDLPSWARLECVQAGTTGDTIDFAQISSGGGYLIPDGTAVWIIDDARDGTPVGMVRASLYLPDGYIKANGATVLRADYPRLVNLADKHNLWTEDTANYPGLFGVGDGLTTFIVPNWIDRMPQFGTGIGTAISAGLPNITGGIGNFLGIGGNHAEGLAYISSADNSWFVENKTNGGTARYNINFNAALSSNIYGKSNTVQPAAIGVLPILKY